MDGWARSSWESSKRSFGKGEQGQVAGGIQVHCHSVQNWGWESQSTSALSVTTEASHCDCQLSMHTSLNGSWMEIKVMGRLNVRNFTWQSCLILVISSIELLCRAGTLSIAELEGASQYWVRHPRWYCLKQGTGFISVVSQTSVVWWHQLRE